MKTLKLALVATIVAFAMVSTANADGFKSKPKFTKSVTVTLAQAMQDPGLVVDMLNQINPDDILKFGLPPYIFQVKHDGSLYVISGTRLEWLRFFRIQGISPAIKKEVKVIID
jgi:hypothetical protein